MSDQEMSLSPDQSIEDEEDDTERKWYGEVEQEGGEEMSEDDTSSEDYEEEEENEEQDDDDNDESEKQTCESSSNIHISNEYMELEEPTQPDEKKALLEEFERKRRARMINVPTDDYEVKQILRQYEEPICLFGEGPADRRNRLKDFLSRQEEDKGLKEDAEEQQKGQESQKLVKINREETWYHRGPTSLKEARMFLVNYSIPRARAKLKQEILDRDILEATKTARKQEVQSKLRAYELIGSQNADNRPISYCSFSPNGEKLATSSWSGLCKVWSVPDCRDECVLRGHNSYVDCVEWHPGAMITIEPTQLNLASSSRDGSILLWTATNSDPIGELPKLEARVSRVKFHPSGRFIGVCVHDNSWRLWDLHMKEEVLFQEGHSKPVYCIDFQQDGALAATGGTDCYGRIWDLRTGRCIMFMSEHTCPILSVNWAPNGYHLASGSEDNTVKIWDVRMRRTVYTIPAHTSIITGVVYDPCAGQYLVTCSYDGIVKLWCNGSFQPLKALEGHGQKVMSAAIAPDANFIATASFDRTFKIWGPD